DASVPNRTWVGLDESVNLGFLPILPHLLRTGREAGITVHFGLQDVPAMTRVYGEPEAMSLLASFDHKIFLRNTDPATVRWIVESTGKHLVREEVETFSPDRSAVTSIQRKHVEKSVLPDYELTRHNRPGRLLAWANVNGIGVWSTEFRIRDAKRDFPLSAGD